MIARLSCNNRKNMANLIGADAPLLVEETVSEHTRKKKEVREDTFKGLKVEKIVIRYYVRKKYKS